MADVLRDALPADLPRLLTVEELDMLGETGVPGITVSAYDLE